MSRTPLLLLALAWLLIAPLPPVAAEEAVSKAAIKLDAAKVKPLAEILALARKLVPGKVIDVELELDVDLDDEQPEAHWVYEVEILTPANRVVELEFDAMTGQLVEIDGAPWPKGVPKVKR